MRWIYHRVVSRASTLGQSIPFSTLCLWEVLDQWGSMWMWEDLELTGSNRKLRLRVLCGDYYLVTGMRGGWILYQGDIPTYLFSVQRGEAVSSASSQTKSLQLVLAIHLILLAVNKLTPTLSGSTQIYSDCSLGGSPRCWKLASTSHFIKLPSFWYTQSFELSYSRHSQVVVKSYQPRIPPLTLTNHPYLIIAQLDKRVNK